MGTKGFTFFRMEGRKKGRRLCIWVRLRIHLLWLDTNTSPPIRVIATVEKYTFPNQVNAIFLSTEENIVVQHNGVLVCIICRVSKTLILMNNKNVMSHVVYYKIIRLD